MPKTQHGTERHVEMGRGPLPDETQLVELMRRNFAMASLVNGDRLVRLFADPRPLIGVRRHASGRPRKNTHHRAVIRRGGGHATARIPRRAEGNISGASGALVYDKSSSRVAFSDYTTARRSSRRSRR